MDESLHEFFQELWSEKLKLRFPPDFNTVEMVADPNLKEGLALAEVWQDGDFKKARLTVRMEPGPDVEGPLGQITTSVLHEALQHLQPNMWAISQRREVLDEDAHHLYMTQENNFFHETFKASLRHVPEELHEGMVDSYVEEVADTAVRLLPLDTPGIDQEAACRADAWSERLHHEAADLEDDFWFTDRTTATPAPY